METVDFERRSGTFERSQMTAVSPISRGSDQKTIAPRRGRPSVQTRNGDTIKAETEVRGPIPKNQAVSVLSSAVTGLLLA
jgi:hypothetical protein